MKKRLTSLLCVSVLAFGLTACIGSGQNADVTYTAPNTFPSMTGIDLRGNERPIPESLEGSYKIVTVAFERKQQDLVDTWIPFATKLEEQNPDVQFYELPIIYEMSAIGRFWVNNGMRSGIKDTDARTRTITIYTERDKLAKEMNLDMTTITTFIMDADNTILWRETGPLTKAYRTRIEELLND